MDKVYAVSDKHDGPWLGETGRPELSLAKGRAMWGKEAALYIAEVRPLVPSDGLPSIAVLVGDCAEALVDKHGHGAGAVFDDRSVMVSLEVAYDSMKLKFDTAIEEVSDIDFMVTTKIKKYSALHNVKVGDFK